MEMGRLACKDRRAAAIPQLLCKIQYVKKESYEVKEDVYWDSFNFSQNLSKDCSNYGPAGPGVNHDDKSRTKR
jgi:hypothetical protein